MTKITEVVLGVSFIILLPVAALAQSASDATYCQALSAKYQRYVGDNDIKHRGLMPDASVDTAIARCQSDAASSIPVLEKALKDAKVDLPPRT